MFKKFFVVLLLLAFFIPSFSFATPPTELVVVDFFYSETCPHCIAEQGFLDTLEEEFAGRYPGMIIQHHVITSKENQALLIDMLTQRGAGQYIGIVPATIIGNEAVVGFDNAEGTGRHIRQLIENQFTLLDRPLTEEEQHSTNPIFGRIDIEKYSLPVLAIILGFLDGFNICSLGALAFILGLVMALGSRKKMLLFGGIFLVTTAIVYGLLIVFWHQLFTTLASYITIMEVFIALLGIGGGIYFLREYLIMRKRGAVCDSSTNTFIMRATLRLQETFQQKKSLVLLTGAILVFAAIVAVVEFPCSAAVPVAFAGILTQQGIVGVGALLHIGLFILFYLLDEIILFVVAAITMRMWFSSPKIAMYAVLAEGLILFAIGIYYLINVL